MTTQSLSGNHFLLGFLHQPALPFRAEASRRKSRRLDQPEQESIMPAIHSWHGSGAVPSPNDIIGARSLANLARVTAGEGSRMHERPKAFPVRALAAGCSGIHRAHYIPWNKDGSATRDLYMVDAL